MGEEPADRFQIRVGAGPGIVSGTGAEGEGGIRSGIMKGIEHELAGDRRDSFIFFLVENADGDGSEGGGGFGIATAADGEGGGEAGWFFGEGGPCAEAAHGEAGDVDAGGIDGEGICGFSGEGEDGIEEGMRAGGIGEADQIGGDGPVVGLRALGGDEEEGLVEFGGVFQEVGEALLELGAVVIAAFAFAVKEEDEGVFLLGIGGFGGVELVGEGGAIGGGVGFGFRFGGVKDCHGGEEKEKKFHGMNSADGGGAEIGNEGFGDFDGAIGLLVLLEEGDVEAGEGGAGAIESERKAIFPIGVFEAGAHAACLIIAEAGAGGDFEVFAVAGGPDFDVVGFGCGLADIAGAELDDAVVEAEFSEDRFGVGGEFLENLEAGIGMDDLNEFDFIELVHADDAFVIAARGAGLAAEAGGIGNHFHGKNGGGDDGIPVEIGDGDFGGGGEEEGVAAVGFGGFGAEHVVLEFRELAGAFHALAEDEVGDIDLLVAVGGLGVQEEADEGALEAGAFAAVDGEAGAGEADGIVP